MKSLNHQIAHEILHSYVHNKEAAHLYQAGFLKAAIASTIWKFP